jgi:hypothetical protein
MGGFDKLKTIEKYLVPDEYEPVVVLAVGRKETSDARTNEMQIELNRIPLYDILFENKFAKPHSILLNQNAMNN